MVRVFNQYVSIKTILLISLESFLIVLSVILGAKFRFWNQPVQFSLHIRSEQFLLEALTVLLVLGTCCYYNDLYDLQVIRVRGQQYIRLAQALGAGCILLGLLYYIVPGLLEGHEELLIAVILTTMAISGMRVALDLIWPLTRRERNVLILGNGDLAATIAHELAERPDLNFHVVGFVTPANDRRSQLFGSPVLGTKDELC